jgi:hypothetical protein
MTGRRSFSAEEWFSGAERLPYDPERASFDHSSPLRVWVRHASGTGTTLTFLPRRLHHSCIVSLELLARRIERADRGPSLIVDAYNLMFTAL